MSSDNTRGFIGRVIQHLNLKELFWIIQPRYRIEQSANHIHLVIHRQLNSYRRKFFLGWLKGKRTTFIPKVGKENVVSVNAIHQQKDENNQVANNYSVTK